MYYVASKTKSTMLGSATQQIAADKAKLKDVSNTYKSNLFGKEVKEAKKTLTKSYSDFKKVELTGSTTRNEKNWASNIGQEWGAKTKHDEKIFASKKAVKSKKQSMVGDTLKVQKTQEDYQRPQRYEADPFSKYEQDVTPEQNLERKIEGSRMRHMKEFFGERFEQ